MTLETPASDTAYINRALEASIHIGLAVLLAAAHIHVSAQITPLEDAAMTTIAFARRQECCGRSLAVPQSVDRDGRPPRWEGPPRPAADGFLAARSHAQCRPSGPVIQRHARRGCG